ncbi:hypothetical protein V6N12_066502 [Hibiscus sabdariffa]|uniref:Uncharacterized protein n=1 Tax=Hibiscus sabdariffa TaxID=183260 RepID=A0ABR2CQZ7_9ROSI
MIKLKGKVYQNPNDWALQSWPGGETLTDLLDGKLGSPGAGSRELGSGSVIEPGSVRPNTEPVWDKGGGGMGDGSDGRGGRGGQRGM